MASQVVAPAAVKLVTYTRQDDNATRDARISVAVNPPDEAIGNGVMWLNNRTVPVVLTDASQEVSKEVGAFRLPSITADRAYRFAAGAPLGGNGTRVRFTRTISTMSGFDITITRSDTGQVLGVFPSDVQGWLEVVWSTAVGDWIPDGWSDGVTSIMAA